MEIYCVKCLNKINTSEAYPVGEISFQFGHFQRYRAKIFACKKQCMIDIIDLLKDRVDGNLLDNVIQHEIFNT